MRLQRIGSSEQLKLADAMRPYPAELARFEEESVDAVSLDYPYPPLHWTESGREVYWIEEAGERVGFALINRHADSSTAAWSVSEFYQARSFRPPPR